MSSKTNVSQIRVIPLLLAAACLLLIALALPGESAAQATQGPAAYPSRWEYHVVPLGAIDGTNQQYGAVQNGTFTKPFEDGLGKFGNDGWELVTIETLQSNKIAIFKRPLAAAAR